MASVLAEQLSPARRALLDRHLRGELAVGSSHSIPRRPAAASAPLSYGQQQIWYLSQLAPTSPVYNEAVTIHCPPDASIPALERAFNEVLRRHEAWRTVIRTRDGEPEQVVLPVEYHRLLIVDLVPLPATERAAEAGRQAAADAGRLFDAQQGPLWRATLFDLGEHGKRLHLTLRHLIFDGVSVYQVLLPELIALHDAFSAGLPSPLPEPPIQYGDYSLWQRRWADSPEARAQLDWWASRLAGLPLLELPTDRPRPAVPGFRGRFLPIALNRALTDGLRRRGAEQGATLFMAALAAFQALLHSYSGQEDLVMGTVSSLRARPELEGLLGYFLNPVALRTDLSGDPTFSELLSRVRVVTLDALAHDQVPFELVVRRLQPQRESHRNPVFQVMLSLEPPLPGAPPGWDLTQMDVETGTAKFDLYVELDERPQGLVGRFIYDSDLFDEPSIECMAEQWQTLLGAVVRDPGQRLSQLSMLPARKLKLLSEWNPTEVENPALPSHRIFEEQATANGKLDRSALPAPDHPSGAPDDPTPPRTELEAGLVRIWRRVLATATVGVHDDFFELGGHSLLAVRMLAEVERDLKRRAPVAALISVGSTIAGLAEFLEQQTEEHPSGSPLVVPVRPDGSRPPLFFIEPDESGMIVLRHLLRVLNPAQPLIGLLPQRHNRLFDRRTALETQIGPVLQALRDCRPHGPYLLCGHSLGGILAYEIAGQLKAAGETVAWLGVLDTMTPESARRVVAHQRRPSVRLARLSGELVELWRLSPNRPATIRVVLARRGRRLGAAFGRPLLLPDQFDQWGAEHLLLGHDATPHDVPLDLFRTDTTVRLTGSDSLGWQELHLGTLRTHSVQGEHNSLLQPPHVDSLLSAIVASLEATASVKAHGR